jgi:hypothetical protein
VKADTQQSVERKLLLALLGRREGVQDETEMLSLLRQVNWLNFLNSTSEDLYPYLAFALEPYVSILQRPPEWERLFTARRLTAVHNLLLRHELGRILNALQESGIPALALKGVVLAHTVYSDPSLRPMSDIDLLVSPDKREDALRVVRTLGYDYPESMLAINRDHILRLAPNQEFARGLQLRGSRVFLEVHSQLECSEPSFPMPVQEFWSRSILVDLRGITARTLCPEDFLFHLCLHLSRSHRFEKGLLPLVDLKLLLDSRSDWNWGSIGERSLRCGCATWMYLTLEVARDLVGATVPDSFFQALSQPHDLSKLRTLTEEQIWSARGGQPVIPPFLPTLLAEFSWRRRARILLNRMRLVGRGELVSEPTIANHARRARLRVRRLLATLKIKIPRYVLAWKSGHLRLRTIWRNAMLLRKSNKLFLLIEEETTCADHGSLAESTSRADLKGSAVRARPVRFE